MSRRDRLGWERTGAGGWEKRGSSTSNSPSLTPATSGASFEKVQNFGPGGVVGFLVQTEQQQKASSNSADASP